jgi:hypothetical protein
VTSGAVPACMQQQRTWLGKFAADSRTQASNNVKEMLQACTQHNCEGSISLCGCSVRTACTV